MRNGLNRAGAVIAAAVVGAALSLSIATTALAHAEIEVEPARAGATDAVITVFPEAHNHHAGTVSVEVFLPEGIAPTDVTLLDGPEGWEMTTGEQSYTIAGDELDVDVSALHLIQVRQLPDVEEIYFRILVTYRDGQVDRWIELPSEDNPDPSHGAPGAELAPAEPVASPTPPPRATTPSPAAPTPSAEAGTDLAAAGGDAGNTGLLVAVVVIVAALATAAVGLVLHRRRASGLAPEER
jgi:uncharacterized protein YcnI